MRIIDAAGDVGLDIPFLPETPLPALWASALAEVVRLGISSDVHDAVDFDIGCSLNLHEHTSFGSVPSYTIERTHHLNKTWWEPSVWGGRFHDSSRLFSEATIEGDSDQMLGIARGIRQRGTRVYTRCAVSVSILQGRAYFWSPRNSSRSYPVTLEEADAFAERVENRFRSI